MDGFFTLVFGLSSIYTLTVISITRYIKGCHPGRGQRSAHQVFTIIVLTCYYHVITMCVSAHYITRTSVFVCLLLIWIAAGFWSGAPLLGWGSYTGKNTLTCDP